MAGSSPGGSASHLESIRELERSANFTVSGACSAPDMSSRPGEPTVGGPDWWTTMDAQYDIVEKAFACDLTRVVTMDLNNADNSGLLPCKFGGAGMVAGGAHGYSHSAPDGPQMATIQNAFAEHLARFLGKLDAIKEGDRSALDNTIIAWSSEVNNGGSHSIPDSPFLLVGSAGGYFKTGRFIDFMNASQRTALDGKGNTNNVGLSPASGGIAHGTLLVSFLQAMGVEAQTFGNPAFSKGPAPMLT